MSMFMHLEAKTVIQIVQKILLERKAFTEILRVTSKRYGPSNVMR
jgi:hypothetical protein